MSYINRDFSPPVERQKRRETKKTLETHSTKNEIKKEKRQNWSQNTTGSKRLSQIARTLKKPLSVKSIFAVCLHRAGNRPIVNRCA